MIKYNYKYTQLNALYCLENVKDIKGNVIEIGTYKGKTLKLLIPKAKSQKKICLAVDSFKGMAKPTKYDFHYNKGDLSVGGIKRFVNLMFKDNFIKNKDYKIYGGFIPECLNKISKDKTFSFIYVDVDQYLPTAIAVKWAWGVLNKNGIMLVDDYFPIKYKNKLATKAILEFMQEFKNYRIFSLKYKQHQIAFKKL